MAVRGRREEKKMTLLWGQVSDTNMGRGEGLKCYLIEKSLSFPFG